MEKFKKIVGIAAPFTRINVDTDLIIPAENLKTISRKGLGKDLFSYIRFNEDGTVNEKFVLNQPVYKNSVVLITGKNFGCGSSREHAVWALKDFGFDVIISPSFADIFYSNCFKNGVLPIILDIENIKKLLNFKDKIELDLQSQTINFGSESINFQIDSHRKTRLLEGLDDIDLTLKEDEKIENFEKNSSRISIFE